jgi:heme exporter protein D
MLFVWIFLGIAVIALIVMIVIFARHWQEIALLKPESIQEEREKQKRDQLITQRFDRLKSEKFAPLLSVGKKVITTGKTKFHAGYLRLRRLEKYYQQAKAPFASMAPSVKDRLKSLMDDARSLARDQKWADAERRYLEVLAIDARSWDAYKGLGLPLRPALPRPTHWRLRLVRTSSRREAMPSTPQWPSAPRWPWSNPSLPDSAEARSGCCTKQGATGRFSWMRARWRPVPPPTTCTWTCRAGHGLALL